MKSTFGVESCCTQSRTQWWLVITSPSGDTKLAEQPPAIRAEESRTFVQPLLARREAVAGLHQLGGEVVEGPHPLVGAGEPGDEQDEEGEQPGHMRSLL